MGYSYNSHAVEAIGGLFCPAMFDVFFMAIALGVLLLFGDEFPAEFEFLTALHFLHLALVIPAIVVFVYTDLLYRGIFFLYTALPLLILDFVILIWRLNLIRDELGTSSMSMLLRGLALFSLLLLDLAFFVTSLFYLGAVGRATAYYGLGSSGEFDPAKPKVAERVIVASPPYGAGPDTSRLRLALV